MAFYAVRVPDRACLLPYAAVLCTMPMLHNRRPHVKAVLCHAFPASCFPSTTTRQTDMVACACYSTTFCHVAAPAGLVVDTVFILFAAPCFSLLYVLGPKTCRLEGGWRMAVATIHGTGEPPFVRRAGKRRHPLHPNRRALQQCGRHHTAPPAAPPLLPPFPGSLLLPSERGACVTDRRRYSCGLRFLRTSNHYLLPTTPLLPQARRPRCGVSRIDIIGRFSPLPHITSARRAVLLAATSRGAALVVRCGARRCAGFGRRRRGRPPFLPYCLASTLPQQPPPVPSITASPPLRGHRIAAAVGR